MVEKDSLFKGKVRHVGTFDFKETYRVMFEWLIGEGYDIDEKYYKEIITGSGPNGPIKEVDVWWEATKKISEYNKFFMTIRFHPLAMTSVEVEINGVKQKMNKGDFTIEFSSTLLKDYEDSWNSPFLKNLRRLYENTLVRERTEQYEGKLITELQQLQEYVKSFLELTGRK